MNIFRALALLLVLATPTSAQTLDLTGSTGRFFNIATGEWTIAAVPGFEFGAGDDAKTWGGFTFDVSWWLDMSKQPRLPDVDFATTGTICTHCGGTHYFEQEWSATWTKEWTVRFTTTVTGALYIFRELGTDRVWMVETRYRVFGRN